MNVKHTHGDRSDRWRFYVALSLAVPLLACLLLMAWNAMRQANPWFSGVGLAAAAVYLIAEYLRRVLRPGAPLLISNHLAGLRRPRRKPVLRLVKK